MAAQAQARAALWRRFEAAIEPGSVAVLGIADTREGNGQVLYCVPERPLLASDRSGRPLFSLAAVLKRQPCLDDIALAPLVSSAFVGLTVSLDLPEAVLARVAAMSNAHCLPLFARSVTFRLDLGRGAVQTIEAQGTGARAAFSVSAGAEQIGEVFAALRGDAGAATLGCTIAFRTESGSARIRLTGNWAEVYDALAARFGSSVPFGESEFRAAFDEFVQHGIVVIDPAAADLGSAFRSFLRISGFVAERRYSAAGAVAYVLRPRPNPLMQLDTTVSTTAAGEEGRLDLSASLADVIGGCLDGRDPAAFMQFVGPDGGQVAPIGLRSRQPAFRDAAAAVPLGKASLARLGGQAVSLAAAARPQPAATANAHALMTTELVKPQAVAAHANVSHWLIDDLAVTLPSGAGAEQPRALPVVEDATAPLWADRVTPATRWYAPAFVPVAPAPNLDWDASPFQFEFAEAGHTADGRVGLDGSVRIVLARTMSEATRAAWEAAGKPEARPVETRGLSIGLAVPFRDQAGAARTEILQADLEDAGETVVATVRLKDDWLRLCYGALAVENFQAEPARLSIAYSFEAYVPLTSERLSALFDRKQALTPIRLRGVSGADPTGMDYLDARDLTYHGAAGELHFSPEPPAASGAGSRGMRPVNAAMVAAVKPSLAQSSLIAEIVRARKYGVQSLGRELRQDVLYPCRTLGAFYRQAQPDGSEAIGCRDAFTLGQTEFREYERMLDAPLQHSAYTVWRSLQQPDRFMVVPAAYCIARFPPADADRAYRPTIFLYSTVDATVPANNRCVVLATLVPDLSDALLRDLQRRLRDFAEAPIALLVNEVDAETSYEWLVAAGPGPVTTGAVKHHDGFQVSIAAGIEAVPQLQRILQTSGISASVTFTLPDGTQIRSALVLDLNRIVGPPPEGPVAVQLGQGACTLANRIERPIDIADLRVETGDGNVASVRVERRLASGESVEVALPAAASHVDPVASLVAGDAATIPEIRSFIEDVHTNVAFVNLVNFANHGLQALSVSARLKGVEGARSAGLSEAAPVAELDFVLPLTAYAGEPVLEFQVSKTTGNGPAESTPWLEWPLASKGNVISLTWEMIQ